MHLPERTREREADGRIAAVDPVRLLAFVEQELQRPAGRALAGPGMRLDLHVHTTARELEAPPRQRGAQRDLVVPEDRDVDVRVRPRHPAEREVERPSTGDGPGGERAEDRGDLADLEREQVRRHRALCASSSGSLRP